MSPIHPYVLSPLSAEVSLRRTINTTQPNVTDVVAVELCMWRDDGVLRAKKMQRMFVNLVGYLLLWS